MTEIEFHQVIDGVSRLYDDEIWREGGELRVNKAWSSPVVNATASQNGGQWSVSIYGGLARHEAITPDGLALVVCHEFGHHLGGFPFLVGSISAEGNADYFANHVCLQQLWGERVEENALAAESAPVNVRQICDLRFSEVEDRHLCYRKLMAGQSVAALFDALLDSEISALETPDANMAPVTILGYPSNQCRLDTYVAASQCKVSPIFLGIPWSENDLSQSSCYGREIATGKRPRCWFAPMQN